MLQGESTVRNEAGLIRLLGYSFLIIVLFGQEYAVTGNNMESTSIGALFLYLICSFFVYFVIGEDKKPIVHRGLLFIDSIICGVFLAYLNDSELIMFMLLIVQTFVFVSSGGIAYWSLFMVISLIVNLLMNDFKIIEPIKDVSMVAEIIGGFYTMLFTLIVSLQRRDRTRKLIGTRLEQLETIKKLKNKSDILAQYLSPQIVEMHEKKGVIHSNLRRKVLTICFIDLVGFSTLTEESEPEDIARILKDFFSRMSRVAINNGGTIDKFIGDGMMVFFGDPVTNGITADANSAVKMAVDMQRAMKGFNKKWGHILDKEIQIRVGINTGLCHVGNVGSNTRFDYTAIGKAVNIASRIEGIAEAGGVCVGKDTYKLTNKSYEFTELGEHQLKGMQKKEVLYSLNLKKGKMAYEKITVGGATIEIKAKNKKEIEKIKLAVMNNEQES